MMVAVLLANVNYSNMYITCQVRKPNISNEEFSGDWASEDQLSWHRIHLHNLEVMNIHAFELSIELL